MSELALAAFAAARDAHAVDRDARSREFASFKAAFDANAYCQGLAAGGLRWVARSASAFPPLLRSIHDPPPGLFVRGSAEVDLLARPAVAVVGARSCTDYGAHVARSLGRELAAAGVVVVSGLARGIDGWAHRGALEGGGPTIAVLGCASTATIRAPMPL
jgi:DNA processing protein